MKKFIHIRSAKFPILPGEKEELVNDGMYGKSLAQYLQTKLVEKGYNAPFICCEDWGWWVELAGVPFAFGICIYCLHQENADLEYVCADGTIRPRQWSWRRFWFVDTAPWVNKLNEDLLNIFQADHDVQIMAVTDEFPFMNSILEVRWRNRFADFLDLLASGQRDDAEWSAVVITHYPDNRLEKIRQELVRLTISMPNREIYSVEEVIQLQKWADELRD